MATKVFLHDAASDIDPSAVETEKLADLTQGAAAATKATNTALGPTAGIQATDGAGGAPLTWFTGPLQAMTISRTITFNICGFESAAAANAGPQVKVERCDGAGIVISTVVNSEYGTEFATPAESANSWTATPTATTLADGDRLKITLLGNDAGGVMAAGATFSIVYDGATGATGDTYVQFGDGVFLLASQVKAGRFETQAFTLAAAGTQELFPPLASTQVQVMSMLMVVSLATALPAIKDNDDALLLGPMAIPNTGIVPIACGDRETPLFTAPPGKGIKIVTTGAGVIGGYITIQRVST